MPVVSGWRGIHTRIGLGNLANISFSHLFVSKLLRCIHQAGLQQYFHPLLFPCLPYFFLPQSLRVMLKSMPSLGLCPCVKDFFPGCLAKSKLLPGCERGDQVFTGCEASSVRFSQVRRTGRYWAVNSFLFYCLVIVLP